MCVWPSHIALHGSIATSPSEYTHSMRSHGCFGTTVSHEAQPSLFLFVRQREETSLHVFRHSSDYSQF